MTNVLSINGEFEKAEKYYNEALMLLSSSKTTKDGIEAEAFVYWYGGNFYFYQKQFSKALEEYFKARNFSLELKEENQASMIDL
ncbi:MAG: hypothetical protein HC854_10435, partial [Flavobacterium sp.]|nr:hypothetical protein [Flavobacterium sp.]